MATGGLKRGEKILLGVIALIFLFALASFIMMEIYRAHLNRPMYADATHFDFSEEGLKGSALFRHDRCTSCHRAVRNGTNNGVDLDGVGSKRSLQYLVNFLKDPEATYGTRTLDHGPAPKEAAYVAELPEQDRHAIAQFLSELRANRGSPDAPLPPQERSGFIDEMVKVWAPDSWKADHHDVRQEGNAATQDKEQGSATSK